MSSGSMGVMNVWLSRVKISWMISSAFRSTSEISLAIRRPDTARLTWAKKTAVAGLDLSKLSRPQIYAREALLLAELPQQMLVRLQAIRIGDIAIGAIPCEVFAETGLAIKQQSPFKPTFTIELANGYSGYLPTPGQHALGGYETWRARSSYLETEAATKILDTLMRLFAQLR